MWGEFLTEKGIVEAQFMRDLSVYFQLYQAGTLDIREYQKYLLSPLAKMDPQELAELRAEFTDSIRNIWRPAMLERINWHRKQGHSTVLISASNHMLVEPISEMLNFPYVICTRVELVNNLPTGEIIGIPAYKDGKVQNLATWLFDNSLSLEDSWVYSDSLNDRPILEKAEHPVAVTPDAALRKHALLKGWRILDL